MAAAVGAFFRKHLVSSCGLPSCCCCWGHLCLPPPPLAAVADGAEFYLPVTPARVPNRGQPRDSTAVVPLAFKHLKKLDFFVLLRHTTHSSQYLAIAYLICCPTAATAPLRWNRPPPRWNQFRSRNFTQILLVLINQKRMCPRTHTETRTPTFCLLFRLSVPSKWPPSAPLEPALGPTDTHKHTH